MPTPWQRTLVTSRYSNRCRLTSGCYTRYNIHTKISYVGSCNVMQPFNISQQSVVNNARVHTHFLPPPSIHPHMQMHSHTMQATLRALSRPNLNRWHVVSLIPSDRGPSTTRKSCNQQHPRTGGAQERGVQWTQKGWFGSLSLYLSLFLPPSFSHSLSLFLGLSWLNFCVVGV